MKKTICIFLFCSVAITSQCQFIDTLQAAIQRKGSFTFNFNSRDSYIGTRDAPIFGIIAGVCFGDKVTLGGGYNALSSPVYANEYLSTGIVKTELNFSYFTYFAEYSINLTQHWEIDIPVFIGIGGYVYRYTLNNNATMESHKAIMPLEPQVELDYNFNKYWGLSTQVGYRLMLMNNNLLNEDLNAITYSVGLNLSPFEIYAHFFPDTKLGKLIEDND